MPPRRSTRSSLPTPAQSSKANSTASTSPSIKASGKKVKVETGLLTPASMASAGFEDHAAVDDAAEDSSTVVEIEGNGLKAVATPVDDGEVKVKTEVKLEAPALIRKGSKRAVMESVTLPARRSKLSMEKTDSLDNMTLDTKAGTLEDKVKVENKDGTGNEDELAMGSDIDEHNVTGPIEATAKAPPARKALSRAPQNGGRPSHQPFNVGKHSTVQKESADTLALDSDDSAFSDSDFEDEKPVKGKGKGKKKAAPKGRKRARSESDSPLSDDPADDDFALNSDEEEKQLARALRESVKAEVEEFETPPRGKAARGRGRGKGKAVGQAVGGRSNGTALRAAVARAAELRANPNLASGLDTPMSLDSDSSVPPFGDASPLPGPSTRNTPRDSGSSTPFNQLDFSDDSEDDSFSDSDLSDDSVGPSRKGKSKGKGKGRKSLGAGRRLDTGDIDLGSMDPGIIDDQDLETRYMTMQKLKEERRRLKRENEAELEPIKKEERRLKKELGRKLTNGERNLIRLKRFHPELADVWGDLKQGVVPVKPVPMEAHPSLKLTLLPFQKESLYWMKKQEEGPWKGGMLADEMGMGKTIQTIALLLSEPRRKPSLVVAPVVALMQWKNEIETHATGFKVCLWHGQGRMKASELKKYDVVLSSYGTLEAAFRRQQRGFKRGDVFIKEKSPMHEFQWFRVVLDEAHNIKERSTNAAKAAFALDAEYKWCLSGTPLQNRVGELYSLVRFLGADPFSHYFCKKCDCKSLHWAFKDKRHCDQCGHTPMHHVCFWNTEILTPIAKYGITAGNPGHTAFKKLKILLDRMMLRRTKLERADDLGLPPRTIVVRRDYFSPAEKELYMSLFSDAKRTFATYVDSGTVLNNYSNIFSLITRMRQMACHPDLVLRSKNSVLVQNQSAGTVCRLCNDQAEDAIISQCKHLFDRECIRQYLDIQSARGKAPECPVCHIEISIDLEAEAVDVDEMDDKRVGKAKQGILSRLNLDNWRSSSKLEALVEELEKLRNKDCTIKSLVFSQFVSFLDLIAFRLQRAGFNICRLEGGMTPQQRDATIQHFMKNTEVTVFLISLKAGGVALNLTEASMVFMMDSWWNPSVEYQAMDRIHRLGQKRPVKVVKLVVEDSIEDQIVQLQAKKLAMTEAALSTDPDSALGKLTVEDLGFLFKM